MVSPGARLAIPSGLFAPYELVREIGARPNPTYVVRLSGTGQGGKPQLAVAERFAGAGKRGDAAGEELTLAARRIATLASPNLARTRDVTLHDDDLVVTTDFVEGEKLQELWPPQKLPLEVALRIIVDVLTGAGALHVLRDAKQQPMKLAHGEISPATVVFALDGVARLLHSVSRCAPGARAESASARYLAPEVSAGEPYDARADVFGAGVLLWEALSGERLFAGSEESASTWRARGASVPRPPVPEKAAWAKGLVDVAVKALAFAPDDRWPTAAVMAAEVRKAAGLKLAPASTAAAFAKSAIGERVKARREILDGGTSASASPAPPVAASPVAAPPATTPAPAAVTPKAPAVAAKAAETTPKPGAAAATTAATPKPAETTATRTEAISVPPISLSDADLLGPASESVLVAPGIRAQVAEVVELESESLVEAAPSVPPSAASSAPGGFLLDPFAASKALRGAPVPQVAVPPSPPPAPVPEAAAPAIIPSVPVMLDEPTSPSASDPVPPSITGAPHFAAAIDLPPPSPVYQQPETAGPAFGAGGIAAAADEADDPVVLRAAQEARRRKAYVLGGVGLLGLVVFILAAVRIAQRRSDEPAAATTATASAVTAVAAAPPPPPTTAATQAPTAPKAPPPSQPVAAATTAAAQPAASPKPTTKPPPWAAAAPRTTPAAIPHSAPAARPGGAPRPRPKPTFDPNSL